MIGGRSGDDRAGGEVGAIAELDSGNELAGADETALELGHARGGDEIARGEFVARAEGGGEADGLAAVGAGGHDAGGAERDVRRAGDAAGEEEVREVARVEAAIRNRKNALGVPLLTAGFLAVDARRGVKIDGPTAEGNGVGLRALLDEVALGNHEISLEAAALAFAGDGADPFEGEVGGFGKLAGVFNVVPHAVRDLPELPFDFFGIVHGVAETAVFDPPEAAAELGGVEIAEARDLRDVLECVAGRREFHGPAGVLGVKINRVAEELGVRGGGGEGLVELGGGLGADAERGAGKEADDTITRGVDEEGRGECVGGGVLGIESADGADGVGAGFIEIVNSGVEEEREAFFRDGFFEENGVPNERVALGVAVLVFEEELVDHAALARPAVVVTEMGRGAEDPEANLAGGVAAEDGTVLHENDLEAGAGGGDGGAGAGETATDHDEIGGEILLGERAGGDRSVDDHRRKERGRDGETERGGEAVRRCLGANGVARRGARRAGAGAA